MRNRDRVRVSPSLVALLLLCPLLTHAADKSPEEWFDEGLFLVGQQKLAEAEAAFTASVKADPRYRRAWQALAEVLDILGKSARAELCRQQAELAQDAREGDAPPLTPAQRLALLDGGGAAPPPGQPAPPAAPPATPATTPTAPVGEQPALKPLPAISTKGADGKFKPMAKLSQHGNAQYCDLACSPDGTLHAIFNDRPENAKFAFLYYRSSKDNGKTWSEAANLSDDESGRAASYASLTVDGAGRVYAIWKYIGANEILDGPGGYKAGVLTMRCWQGGQWSPRLALNPVQEPIFSFYTTVDPAGQAHLIYSQQAADAFQVLQEGRYDHANRLATRTLDGPSAGAVNVLIEPPPLPTEAQFQAANQAGKPIPTNDRYPKKEGVINLRGGLAPDGRPRFVGEHPGGTDIYGNIATGRRVVLWDGAVLRPIYEFEKYKSFPTWDNPPALLTDPTGQAHLIRAPERSDGPCVRDYPIQGITPTEPLTILACEKGTGQITAFQARNLPGGRMVVMAAKTELGGDNPPDHELFITFSDGGGQWTKPLSVTDNAARANSTTGPSGGAMRTNTITTYGPRYSAVAIDATGHPCVLMVNNEYTAMGGIGRTGSGVGFAGATFNAPHVFFLRL